MTSGTGPEPTGEKKTSEGEKTGTGAGSGKGPESELKEMLSALQDALKEGASEAGRIIGHAREVFGLAEKHIEQGVKAAGSFVQEMREDVGVVFPSTEAKAALRSSAEVWKLVAAATAKDGFVTRADGSYASARFDSFESKVVHIDGQPVTVAVGVVGDKRYLLTLMDPENPKSTVKMGQDGWDSIEAIPRHLIGRRGSEYFFIDPVDGSGKVKIPWSV